MSLLAAAATLVSDASFSPAEAQVLTADDVEARLPAPSALGDGWQWVKPEDPIMRLGSVVSAIYNFREPESDRDSPHVVDIHVHGSAATAKADCVRQRKLLSQNAEVVIDDDPALGPTGFRSHYGPHESFGRRVTFCERNLKISIAPSRFGADLARSLRQAILE